MFSPVVSGFSKPSSCLVLLFFLSSFYHLSSPLSEGERSLCDTLFQCGNLTAGFPFWGESRPQPCGHPSLVLHCDKTSNKTVLIISGQMYSILQIDNSSNTLRLARQDFQGESFCSATFTGTTLTPELFELLPDYKTLFVYYFCDPRLHNPANFTCPKIGVASVHRNNKKHHNCRASFNITVPKKYVPEEEALNMTHLGNVLRNGFKVKLRIDERPCQECRSTGGICAYDVATPVCLIPSEVKRERRNLSGLNLLAVSSNLAYTTSIKSFSGCGSLLYHESVSFLYTIPSSSSSSTSFSFHSIYKRVF